MTNQTTDEHLAPLAGQTSLVSLAHLFDSTEKIQKSGAAERPGGAAGKRPANPDWGVTSRPPDAVTTVRVIITQPIAVITLFLMNGY